MYLQAVEMTIQTRENEGNEQYNRLEYSSTDKQNGLHSERLGDVHICIV